MIYERDRDSTLSSVSVNDSVTQIEFGAKITLWLLLVLLILIRREAIDLL